MITGIQLKNFKCFQDVSINDLSDLNLIVGKNNTGKSAIIQALVLLCKSLGSNIQYDNISARHEADIVYGHDPSEAFTIEVTLQNNTWDLITDIDMKILNTIGINKIESISYELGKDYENLSEVVKINSKEILNIKNSHGTFFDGGTFDNRSIAVLNWAFSSRTVGKVAIDFMANLQSHLCSSIWKELKSIHYISPSRQINRWEFEGSRLQDDIFDPASRADSLLTHIDEGAFSKAKNLFEQYYKWVWNVEEVRARYNENGKFEVVIKDGELANNIVASGFGLNKTLSILLVLSIAKENDLIIIEEPEVHLHSAAQYGLTDAFIDVIERNVRLIIATHSEPILRRLLRYLQEPDSGIVRYPDLVNKISMYRTKKTDSKSYVVEPEYQTRRDLIGFIKNAIQNMQQQTDMP